MKQKIIFFTMTLLAFLLFQSTADARMNMGTINLKLGDTRTLTSESSTYYTVSGTWSKSGNAISFISSYNPRSCTISADKVGTATVEWKGCVGTTMEEMYWTVNVTGVPVESFTLNKTFISLKPGQRETLTLTVLPNNASNPGYRESSDDTSIATVSLRTITAQSPGDATITFKAKDGSGVYATCSVHVEGERPESGIFLQGDIKQFSVGGNHSMILMTDGSLWACGQNDYGQLCNGTTMGASKPIKVMDGVSFVEAHGACTMIVKTDGSLWACGYNDFGQLGDGTTNIISIPKKIMDDVASVAMGGWHSMILKTDGTLWACGKNEFAQLGDGTTKDRSKPKQVMTDVAAVAAGNWHTMILKTDGSLWACGYNDRGQLAGAKILSDQRTRTPEQVMTGVKNVAAGSNHTMILKNDGSLWTCGEGSDGQLGNGKTSLNNYTVQQLMTNVKAVAAGGDATMIIKNDNSLLACGWNYTGALGDGTNDNRSTPTSIMSGVSEVKTNGHQTIIKKTDGILWACGKNTYGQLGDGTKVDRHTPIQISEPAVKVSSIMLNKTSLALITGQDEMLTAIVKPDNATNKSVNWSSSDTSVASVDSDGKVTVKTSGKVTITCKANDGSGVSATCEIAVTSVPDKIELPATSTVVAGQQITLTPTITPSDAITTLTWSSDDETIAKVNNDGVVTGIKKGQAYINVETDNGNSAYCKLTVTEPEVKVASIKLDESVISLKVGESQSVKATVTPDNATDKTVSWSSSNTSVASVDNDGKVTAKAAGKATITCTANDDWDVWATCEVTVSSVPDKIELPATSTVIAGQHITLSPTITPSDAVTTLTWSSDDETIAKVNSDGVVTGIKKGQTYINVETDNGKSAYCKLTVTEPEVKVTSIKLDKSDMSLKIGERQSVKATVTPDNATDNTVSWSSSNMSVASVDNDGKVTAKAAGKATITCTANDDSGVSATCEVTVSSVPDKIELPATSTVVAGQHITLSPTITPSDAVTTLTWSSDDETIAKVNGDGVVTGLKKGQTFINVETDNGKSAYCKLTVTEPEVKVTSIKLDESVMSLKVGESQSVKATVTPDNATDKTVNWISSNSSVAAVDDNGKVTAKASGKATITCTANDGSGVSATCEVTVSSVPENIKLPSTATVVAGQQITLTPTITPSDAITTLTWSSDDETIAKVNSDGVLTGVKKGQTFINVETDNGKSAYCKLTVTASEPVEITLPKNATVIVGETLKLTPTLTPEDSETVLTWSSDDETIVTVNADGMLTGVAEGLAIVTVKTSNGITSNACKVKVELPSAISEVQATANTKTPIFTVSGQRIKTLRKGVNIVGGKKIVVK